MNIEVTQGDIDRGRYEGQLGPVVVAIKRATGLNVHVMNWITLLGLPVNDPVCIRSPETVESFTFRYGVFEEFKQYGPCLPFAFDLDDEFIAKAQKRKTNTPEDDERAARIYDGLLEYEMMTGGRDLLSEQVYQHCMSRFDGSASPENGGKTK